MKQTTNSKNLCIRIKNQLLEIYKDIESKIFYRDSYFLDANFLIPHDDNRHEALKRKRGDFFVTEYISDEIKKKNQDLQNTLSPKELTVVKFDNLRLNFPATCPVFFNFIKGMYNPANICSPDFFINKNFAVKENNKTNKERIDFNQVLISRFYKGHENKFNKLGKKKDDWENYLNSSFLSRLKKRKNKKNKGGTFFNDYRNLSLILIYTLLYRRNVYYYTADIDIFCDLFSWLDSMSHQLTFKTMLLNQMRDEGKMALLKKKKLVFHLDYNEFKNQCYSLLADFSVDNWKKKRFSIFIKYWDTKKQQYNEEVRFSFDEEMRNLILNNHGLLYCPFAANNTYGNFFRYLYFWPPNSLHDLKTIKVSVQAKSLIHAKNAHPPKEVHDCYCKFKKQDYENDINLFESFRVAG